MSILAKSSRLLLVGQLNAPASLKPADLDGKVWKRHTLCMKEFDSLNKTYYTAHIQAMAEVKGVVRPEGMPQMYRYDLRLRHRLRRCGIFKDYRASIKRVSVWFFPNGINLFSIEIDDSGMELASLTLMHRWWKCWSQGKYECFGTKRLEKKLEPLAKLTSSGIGHLTFQDTKLRQYQVIEVDEPTLRDDLLYELATHSKVGLVADNNLHAPFKPSDEYFNSIIRDNSVSIFSNWKALALNDTFTVLTIDGIFMDSELDKDGDGYRYFEMLYMRCLVQEYYCFSRNNDYREKPDRVDADKMDREIETMEKYYFYDDLSYDFLPAMMYNAMVKGLGLEGDRRELVEHVKQAMKELQRIENEKRRKDNEERRNRNDKVVSTVKIFAAVTIVATVSQMFAKIVGCLDGCLAYDIATLVFAIVFVVWLLCKTRNKKKK